MDKTADDWGVMLDYDYNEIFIPPETNIDRLSDIFYKTCAVIVLTEAVLVVLAVIYCAIKYFIWTT